MTSGGATASLLATQLLRHPSLTPVERSAMYALHPSKTDATGRRYVPAVHRDPRRGASVFVYPFSRHGYRDRMLPDGRTVEYSPSGNSVTNRDLDALVGQEVILYAQLGGAPAHCRQGRVRVLKPRRDSPVFHLCILAPPTSPPTRARDAGPALAPWPAARPAEAGEVTSWADME